MTFTSKIRGLVAAATVVVFGATGSNAAVIDLGFSLDESGSVGASNFNLTRNALANALALIPTSGPNQYRVAVTTFSGNVTTVVTPTVVTAANIGTIQAAVQSTTYSGGLTNTSAAIANLTNLFTNVGLGDTTLFNITTDGEPSTGGGQQGAINAANAAAAAGVDGLSFEAIGTNQNLINQMLELAFPVAPVEVTDINNIPDPTQNGFVVRVSSFADYEAAIRAKIQQVVIDTGGGDPSPVPLPASLPLLLAGLAGVAALRRRAA